MVLKLEMLRCPKEVAGEGRSAPAMLLARSRAGRLPKGALRSGTFGTPPCLLRLVRAALDSSDVVRNVRHSTGSWPALSPVEARSSY